MKSQWFAAIYGSIAVWMDHIKGVLDIYPYNFLKREESLITAEKSRNNFVRW